MRPFALTTMIALLLGPAALGGRALAQTVDECAQPKTGWIFCSGFEEGNLAVWDDYDGNPPSTNALIAHAGPTAMADNHVMRLRVPEGRGSADLVKVLPGGHDRLYARWYMLWEAGYDFNAPSHGSGLNAGARNQLGRSGYRPTGADWYSAWVDVNILDHSPVIYTYYRGMYQDCVDPAGSCWGDRLPCTLDEGQVYCTNPAHRETAMPPALQTERWYRFEILMDGGTPTTTPGAANGILDMWIDGVEYGPWTDLWLRTTPDLKVTILWLNLFFPGTHSTAGVMIDNVVVSTQPIGPVGTTTGVENPGGANSWGSLKAGYR
jgi:hypothetical protein